MKKEYIRPHIFPIIFLIILAVALSACSSSKTSGKEPGDRSAGLSESDLNAQQEERFAGGGIPTAEGESIFRDIRFSYDSSDIDDIARQNLEHNLQLLQSNPGLRIQLEGHCDERGTAEYNLALGSRRAQAVYDMLASYGISPQRLNTISYGEEVPLDPASNELAYERNRRVHFSAYSDNRG